MKLGRNFWKQVKGIFSLNEKPKKIEWTLKNNEKHKPKLDFYKILNKKPAKKIKGVGTYLNDYFDRYMGNLSKA